MYYYLQESTANWNERKLLEKFKKLVGQFGIAGESVSPSPARTIDELVTIGLEKNYSTFVGVGSDLFLNKVASSLINQRGNFGGERVVLGLVPTDLQGDIAAWLGYRSIESAAAALKSRKVASVDVPLIEPSKYFIAPLRIKGSKVFSFKLATAGYTIDTQAASLSIDRNLRVMISGTPTQNQLVGRLKHFFTGKQSENVADSQLRSNQLRIETLDTIPVYLHSEMIAKTPVSLKIVPQALNLITERGTI